MFDLSRRSFLVTTGVAMAAAAVVTFYRFTPSDNPAVFFDRRLEELILDGNFSADLGEKYLEIENLKTHTALDILKVEVIRDLPDNGDDLRVGIRYMVEQDFAHGKLCQLEGWQLSKTECRLAAIAFLLRESGDYIEYTVTSGPLDGLRETFIAQVEGWGPQSGGPGEDFNLQANGKSALWFRFFMIDPHPYRIYFGSAAARTSVHGDRNLITASLTRIQARQITSEWSIIPVHLVDLVQGNKQLVGYFHVSPRKKPQSHGK